MSDQMIRVDIINGKLQYTFKKEDGSFLICGNDEIEAVLKKIDKGEIKIKSINFES